MEQKNKPPALVGSVYRSKYINIEVYPYSHFAEMKLGYKKPSICKWQNKDSAPSHVP